MDKQIALEKQNEKLRARLFELLGARDRYAYLYDCAPVAHLTINAQGEILEANLTAGKLLGLARDRLVRRKFKRFVAAESQRVCHQLCEQVFSSDARRSLELELVNAQNRRLAVRVEAVRELVHGRRQCRFSLTDVTGLKQSQEALLDAAQFNQQIIASAKEGIIVNDRQMKHLVWNPFMEQLTGIPAAQVIGKHPLEIFPFLKEAGVIRQMKRALAGETGPPIEVRFQVRQSGRSGWATNVSAPLRNAGGEVIGVIGIVNDITERKWAELQLARSEARYRGLFEGMEEGFFLAELVYNRSGRPVDWRFLDVNPAHAKMIGLKREAVVGRTIRELFPNLEQHWFKMSVNCALTGKPVAIEGFTRATNRHYVMHLFSPRRGQFACVFSDITERKLAEAALLAREAQLRSFVAHAPAGIAMFDRKMNYLAASRRWLADHHRKAGDVIGRNHYEVFPDLPARWKPLHRKSLAGQVFSKDEDLWVQANGERVWLDWSMTPWRDDSGKIGGIMILTRDVTRRKKAEESLRLFQTMVNQSNDTFELIDPRTGRFLEVNEKGPAELGCTRAEYLSRRVIDIDPTVNASSWRQLAAKIRTQGSARGEGIHRRKDGTEFPVEFNARWVHLDRDYIVTVVRDITERKQTEQRLAWNAQAKTILAGIDHAIVHVSNRQKLLSEVCRVAVEQGGFKLAWFGRLAPDGSVQPVAQAGATGYLRGIQVGTRAIPAGPGAAGQAIRTNRPVIIHDTCRDPRMAPWRKRLRRFGLNYVAAIPIRVSGQVAGTFQLHATQASFHEVEEMDLFMRIKDDLSFALTALAEIKARKQAEAGLRLSESKLALFFDQAPVGMVWLSARGTILRANQSQLNLLGCRAKNCLGQSFVKFCAEAAQGRELLRRLAAREAVRGIPMILRRPDRAIRHVLVDADPIWINHQFQYSSVFLRDVTDRIQLERGILEISEREHRRIAQDLHDGLGQLLAGTSYLANTARQRLAAKSLPEAQDLARIQEVVSEAVAQTRSLARGLHPVEPDPGGLMAALDALAARTEKLFHVRCRFDCSRPVLIPDDAVATHLFRIAQEALTNAIKHGQTRHIKITLARKRGRVCLVVRNNGTGMSPSQAKSAGMGLRIMHYRARMIRGALSIRELAGGGLRVICSVPLNAENGMIGPPAGKKTKNQNNKD